MSDEITLPMFRLVGSLLIQFATALPCSALCRTVS
jgi:hypothetical protein